MNNPGRNINTLDTPFLWVDLDNLDKNIGDLAAFFQHANVQWRPHTKGIKIPAIAQMLVAAGAIGITCAKLSEAEVMASEGINNILIANQVVGGHKVNKLASLCASTRVIVAVDNASNVVELGSAATAHGVTIGVLVDIDSGMGRAGVLPGKDSVELAKLVHSTAGLKLDGLMAWEGHTLNLPAEKKEKEIRKSVTLLEETAVLCREQGLDIQIVSGGGTGTYQITSFLPGITEIQAGGAIFNDMVYQKWGVPTAPSLFVQTQVTSRPTPKRIIVDAGFKALPSHPAQPHPLDIDHLENYRSSAEHGILNLRESNEEIQIGDRLDFIIGYADATLFLHDKLYGVRNNIVEVVWDIEARGKLQ